MIYRLSITAVIRVLLIPFMIFSTPVLAERMLKVRVTEAPPQYMQQDGRWAGRAVELMEALLQEAGCVANYTEMPWKRAMLELEQGTVDVMMNVGYNETRAKHFHFISPHANETTVLVVRKDSDFDIQSLDDFKRLPDKVGYETGTIRDRNFTQKFNQDTEFREVFVDSVHATLTDMVRLGRLSGALDLAENAKYALKTDPEYAKAVKVHPFRVSSLPTFFAFSKRSVSPELLLRLHKANIRVIARGEYDAIMDKWE